MAQRYYTVTWDQLHRDARALAWRLMDRQAEHGPFTGIVAITRGGLIPAAIIARELELRLIESVGAARVKHWRGAARRAEGDQDALGRRRRHRFPDH